MLWNIFGQVIQSLLTLLDIPRDGGTITVLNINILINMGLLNKSRIGNNSRLLLREPNKYSLTKKFKKLLTRVVTLGNL